MRRCSACHGEDSAKGGYRMDTFRRMSKAGDSDLSPLVAGQTKDSELYQRLIEKDANDRMPQKADALPAREIALIERWIKEGAVDDGGAPDRPLAELVRESLLKPAPDKYAHAVPVTALAFSPDGTRLAVSGYYEVTIWDLDSGAPVRRIGGLLRTHYRPGPASQNQSARRGRRFPRAMGHRRVARSGRQCSTAFPLRPARHGAQPGVQPRWPAPSPRGAPTALHPPLRGQKWKAEAHILRNHADWVETVAFSPDGGHVLSASRDRTVRISRNASTGELEDTFTGHETALLSAIFRAITCTVLSLAVGSPLTVWEPEEHRTKPRTIEITGHPDSSRLGHRRTRHLLRTGMGFRADLA